MTKIKSIISIILLIGAFCFLYFCNAHAARPGYNIGDIAPAFSLTDIDGNQFSLAQNKGKVVHLFFLTLG
jgi:cytochrome oxidase Cu insertion factor (SCO1/SenC/PrrC family)